MHTGHGRPHALDAGWAAALCAGVLSQLFAPSLLAWPLAVALGALGALLHLRAALPRIGALLLGAALCALHGNAAMSQRLPASLDGAGVTVELRVQGLPAIGPRGARFHARIERVVEGPPGAAAALEGRWLSVRWYGGGRALRPGERWRLPLRLATLGVPMNPGDADPSRRALVDGAMATAQVQRHARPLRLGPPGGLHALRDAVSTRIAAAIGAERGRFVAALAVGDTRGLSDADWERLRQFGLTHLIAISGFHVGLVAGLGVLLVRLLWWLRPTLAHRLRRGPAAAIAAVLVATAYAALAGFSLPTVRTVLMIGVIALVALSRARSSPAQPLLIAVAVIVLIAPFAVLTPGFWLSCGGVAWLLWCLPGAANAFDLRLFLKAQWVATLGLLPIAAAFFLQVPIAGPLANVAAIPWISLVVVPLSLLGTVLAPISDALAGAAWALAALSMDGLWRSLDAVPADAAGSLWLPPPPVWAVALAVLGVAVALLPRGVRGRHAGWLLVLPLLFPPMPAPAPGEFAVTALSLPRGDAVLLRTASATVLIDAGPTGIDVVQRLRAMGVDRVDLRIATRRSAGRAGGIAAVDAAFPPARTWAAPGSEAPLRCEAGRRWSIDGVELLAVSPLPGGGGTDPGQACVLRVRGASGPRLWLSSDADAWVARRAVAEGFAGEEGQGARVVGAPASLAVWVAMLGADGGIATRAPGPALSRRWPAALRRVDRHGAVDWRSDPAARPNDLTRSSARWWHAPPR